MTLEAAGTLYTTVKLKYLRTLLRGEALHQFDLLYAEMESENHLTAEALKLGLGSYFSLLICY